MGQFQHGSVDDEHEGGCRNSMALASDQGSEWDMEGINEVWWEWQGGLGLVACGEESQEAGSRSY